MSGRIIELILMVQAGKDETLNGSSAEKKRLVWKPQLARFGL